MGMQMKIKKEMVLALSAAVLTAVLGFFLLQITPAQSLGTGLLTFVLFILFSQLLVPKSQTKKNSEERPLVSYEAYRKLEQKYHTVRNKADVLEKENRGTEMFLASMSHEIRTPLNGIIGLTELLDDTPLTPDQKEFVSLIRESSNNLRVIVNDILDVTKINAGKMELEEIPFDLFAKIENSVAMFVPKMEEKGIILNLFTDPKIPHLLKGDPTRFSQVITNLVSNAVKFTEAGGNIDVYVESVENRDGKATFRVSVSDSGIGLSEAQQKRIFEAYSQAEVSTTRKAGGTGLGLTISSKIIMSMGSTLRVKSQEGEGATFFFTLTLPVAETATPYLLPSMANVTVGVFDVTSHPRSRWHTILETYIRAFGAGYREIRREEILKGDMPDMVMVDHHVLDDEMLASLSTSASKRILLTYGSLQNRLDDVRSFFDEVLFMPVTLEKTGKVLASEQVKEDAENVDKLAVQEKRDAQEKTQKSFEDLHVLVAEDNPINQKLIKIVLENFGLNVTLASNGEEAVEARKNGSYDMIFMDIQMPVMSGVEATHAILSFEKEKNLPHIPIIALTANALAGDKEKYIAEGMDDYATKPLDIKVIEKLIAKYCEITP
jgi:signal transduction histidine kinase/CheY-like chemotaxis protein